MAVAGTAFGTLALAAYTAWLAMTTRREVGLAVDDQRLRDRPVVLATLGGLGRVQIESDTSTDVAVLMVTLRNVGLGPALDIRATAVQGEDRSIEEVVPVILASDREDRMISLSRFDHTRVDGAQLSVEGTYTDRYQRERFPILIVTDGGLADEQRAGLERTQRRAWPNFSVMQSQGRFFDDERRWDQYLCTIRNPGFAVAENVVLEFVAHEDDENPFLTYNAGKVYPDQRGPGLDPQPFQLSIPRPQLSCRMSWTDAERPQGTSRMIPDVFPAAAPVQDEQ